MGLAPFSILNSTARRSLASHQAAKRSEMAESGYGCPTPLISNWCSNSRPSGRVIWTTKYQSPAIESSNVDKYRPGSVSFAPANTGAMPACDMFPSSLMLTPVAGFPEPSVTVSVIVNGPTRGGCGETSCVTVRFGAGSLWCLQACASTRKTQRAITDLRFKNTDQAVTACVCSRRSEQLHVALSSPFGGNM